MRTNIDIDDRLLSAAMAATGLTTKKATVEEALRTLMRMKEREEILTLAGKVSWRGDLGETRKGRGAE